MDATLYNEILNSFLFPYCAANFDINDIVLHQDNDPKHTSKLCKGTLDRLGIKWIKSPANSSDLNPIELLWHSMKDYTRKKFCTDNLVFKYAVTEWADTINPEICQNYINKLKEVMAKVIKNEGGWSNF